MKRADIVSDRPYAVEQPDGTVRRGYVLGFTWSTKGDYYPPPAKRAGAWLLLTEIPGTSPAPDKEAVKFTETRYRASLAYESMFGSDDALDALMIPPTGWATQTLSPERVLMSWDDWLAELERRAQEEVDKKVLYRKLRTYMVKQLQRRDAATSLAQPLPPLRQVERITPILVQRSIKQSRDAAAAKTADAADALEAGEVLNYERAVRTAEAFLAREYQLGDQEQAMLNAHALVLDVANIIIDEPRAISNRKAVIEVASTKKALEDRWRTGSDGNGWDWLGDADPEHVIDVLVGQMIDRGWRPTAS
jgi:hypothetical protein